MIAHGIGITVTLVLALLGVFYPVPNAAMGPPAVVHGGSRTQRRTKPLTVAVLTAGHFAV